MTRTIWIGSVSAIVTGATVAVMAQAPAPQQRSGNSTDRQITVTGCLKAAPSTDRDANTTAGTPGATGTTGAVGAAGDNPDAKFMLTDATTSSAATDPSGASTTTSAGSQPARSAQTYRLIANPAALSPHVGKKLELTGTVEDQPASSPSTSTASPASSANAPALRVEAGKVIAASCEG
jgi:hypothetical protein